MQHVTFDADIAKDPKFDEQLQGVLSEIKEQREKQALEVGGSANLKADSLGNLLKQGKLTVEFIKAEFPKVANKQSQLPSGQRSVITQVVFNAAQRTVLLKRAERAQRIADKANARVASEEAGEPATERKPKGSKRKAKKLSKKGKK